MARGDHIRVRRGAYAHHGIDCGDGEAIHYTGDLKHKRNAAVHRTPLEEFAWPNPVEAVEIVVENGPCFPPEEVVRRAESRLGEARYSFFRGNCEHFARWCKSGSSASRQVATFFRSAAAAGLAAGVVGLAALYRYRVRRS